MNQDIADRIEVVSNSSALTALNLTLDELRLPTIENEYVAVEEADLKVVSDFMFRIIPLVSDVRGLRTLSSSIVRLVLASGQKRQDIIAGIVDYCHRNKNSR